MGLFLPKDVKENVARIIREAVGAYSAIDGYRVHRVSTDNTSVYVMLKGDENGVNRGTYMLNISVKEVR